jgi:UDP-glucose 4-epimerase
MQEHEVKHLVFSSSCTVYGEPDTLPVKEDAPVKTATSPYGNTKQIGEEILIDSTKADKKLNVISLRYFNPIGAHDSALIGELPIGVPNNLVPMITQTAVGIRKQLSVFGNDYNTPDGSCIRDYIHVVDLAHAHIQALKRLYSKQNANAFEVFNIGTGIGYSVLETIRLFEEITRSRLNYIIAKRRPGDVEKVFADTQKAETILGWKARYDLRKMLESAWRWQLATTQKPHEFNI